MWPLLSALKGMDGARPQTLNSLPRILLRMSVSMRPSVFVRGLQLLESFADVGGPYLCPLAQPGDCLFVESVGGEFRVVDPVGSAESRL